MLNFVLPVLAFVFLYTGPHSGWTALLWIIPLWLTVLIDLFSPGAWRNSPYQLPTWAYDGLLYVLAGLQISAIVLLVLMAAQLQWSSFPAAIISLSNLFAVKILIGTNSAFCGIVLAHELIHRPQRHLQALGRLLLSLVCYEHFATEHVRGHHRRVGTVHDPATARYGESYEAFWRRTVPAQFKSAWHMENRRLGIISPFKLDARLLRHRVLQGLLFELVLVAFIAFGFGLSALAAFLIQAVAAVRKLEAVNYIEHWGLMRSGRSVSATDSWDTESWFTLNTMVGLARHADHHLNVNSPYQQLQRSQESPKLPYGYFAMVFFTVFMNRYFQQLLTRELREKGLGPFRNPADARS